MLCEDRHMGRCRVTRKARLEWCVSRLRHTKASDTSEAKRKVWDRFF